ncbi:MAG: putative F420-dependent oxidoreductase [Oceanicoccus sp.]|jgi:probable F420-dependent oxidoreductase
MMKIDGGLSPDLDTVADRIRALEELGFDGAGTAEMNHDPFLPLVLAAANSTKIELKTGIAVAFARSPMVLANLAHDLNAYSKGRFTLGLGSQIKPHISKRFSMPWGKPVPQMRELIQAMRAIWANWYEGKPLEFIGEYYTHTLMTPAFTPENTEYGAPRVILAAVGPLMTQVSGEVADGMIVHPFSNERYIREVTLPAIEKGLKKSGRSREDFEISYTPFIVSGENEEGIEAAKKVARQRISFYGSTPAYKGVLDIHGWGDLQLELNAMSKQGRWEEMTTLITDDMLDVFGVVAEPDKLVDAMLARYGDIVDRTSGGFDFISDRDQRKEMMAKLRAG